MLLIDINCVFYLYCSNHPCPFRCLQTEKLPPKTLASSTAQVVPDSNNVHAPIYSIVIALGTLMVDIRTAHVTMFSAAVIHYTV